MNRYQRIYRNLQKLGLDFDALPDYARSEPASRAYMPLTMDTLRVEEHSGRRAIVIALAHRYELNGDLVPDPDMELRVYPESGMAEALTYQDGWVYQEVYPRPGICYPALRQQLNQFLDTWLRSCVRQGHRLERVREAS